ncbi:MAG: porin [Saprospiraceae bacterium]
MRLQGFTKTNSLQTLQVLAILVFCSFAGVLSAQNQPKVKLKFGKGLQVTAADSSAHIKFNIRFQSLYNSQRSLADRESWESSFLVRRARLKFGGWAINPNLAYKIELALSNRDLGSKHDFGETNEAPKVVLDAVVKWKAHKNLTIWAGQTKLPGNRERVVSSQKLQMVDRSLVNSIFNVDREMGVQLRSKFKIGNGVIKPILSWSFGEGRNITKTNIGGFHYMGRVEWLPLGEFSSKGDYFGSDLKREKTPKLAIAGSYSMNNGAARQKQSGRFLTLTDDEGNENYLNNNLQTIFADMMFKYNGFSLMGEYAHKIVADKEIREQQDLRTQILDDNGRSYYTGSGFNVQAGYLFKKNIEVSARYTNVMPDTDVSFSGVEEYTLGLSKYIVGHALKLQTDVSYLDNGEGSDNDLRYRFQMEFQF